jgi:predicted O-linked N-acetylglucosamine transferase (SPINDLY family)
MDKITQFQTIYDSIMKKPEQLKIDHALIYQLGEKIIGSGSGSIGREYIDDVYNKLVYLFPQKSELYTLYARFMARTPSESMTYHRLALQYNPRNRDSLIPLVCTLFEKEYYNSIFELNVDNAFEVAMDNEQFLIAYGRSSMINQYYVDTMKCLLKLIEIAKANLTFHVGQSMYWSYSNDIGFVYSAMAEADKSVEYMDRAVTIANQYNLTLPNKLMSFCNLMCYYSYGYYENAAIFKRFLEINNYLPNRYDFAFDKKKPDNDKKKKIRIGYVSSDYLFHPVANFMIPIIENHSDRFEIILYANQDFVEPMFYKLNVPIHQIKQMEARTAAQLIYSHGIDILVDLGGHTVNNRLDVFALNPAPIQIAYLGFPNTTGLHSIRYRITDHIADNPNSTQQYSETLLRLPRCFLLYKYIGTSVTVQPKVTDPKCIVLGAINKENKNSRLVLETWSKIMQRCPNTKIIIKLETFDLQPERVEFYRSQLNVDVDRIILVKRMQNVDYDSVFKQFDILLDPFPYSGTTTSCNALYNSLPIITLYHRDYHAHNVTSSILTNTGLTELITYSPEEYIDKACELINDVKRIDEYKANIQTQFRKSMDPTEFMGSYENILEGLYDHEMGLL